MPDFTLVADAIRDVTVKMQQAIAAGHASRHEEADAQIERGRRERKRKRRKKKKK